MKKFLQTEYSEIVIVGSPFYLFIKGWTTATPILVFANIYFGVEPDWTMIEPKWLLKFTQDWMPNVTPEL